MEAERRVQRAKITLMRNPKFALWSGVLMVGKSSVVDDIPTACTNGRDEIYGRKFVQSLSDKELAFVVLHEAAHKGFRHLTIWKSLYRKNPQLANKACDYVINLMLTKLDEGGLVITMPRKADGTIIGCLDERFDNMNAKQVFDILEQEQQQQQEKGEGKGGNASDEQEGNGGDGFDEHDWEGAQQLSEAEQKELEKEIDQAMRQGQMAHQKLNGKGAGSGIRELDDLLTPKVDWRDVLREFVKSICSAKDASSWRRVNRRFLASDIYMPTLIGERVGRLVVAVDTSGSVGGDLLTRFLSEVKSIAEDVHPEYVDLLYWGSTVAQHETYDMATVANIVSSTQPKDGGGTSPSCITAYMKDKQLTPECVVVLTDGLVGSDWGGDWPCPVLWCIVGNNHTYAPVGKTIHVDD